MRGLCAGCARAVRGLCAGRRACYVMCRVRVGCAHLVQRNGVSGLLLALVLEEHREEDPGGQVAFVNHVLPGPGVVLCRV